MMLSHNVVTLDILMSAIRCFIRFCCREFLLAQILNIITIFHLCFGCGFLGGSPPSFCGPATHTHTLEAGPFVWVHCAAGRWAIYMVVIPSPASPEKENRVSTIASALCWQ